MTEEEILLYWMSLIDDEEMLEHWKNIIVDDDPLRKVPEGFFSMFRPNGDGLDKFFEKINKGNEILKRLLEIYEATSTDYDSCDCYFIEKSPRLVSKETIRNIAVEYLARVSEIARIMEDTYFDSFISVMPGIEVVEGSALKKTTNEYSDFDLDCGVYELMGDFIHSLKPEESHALLFKEPLYQIACSYDIVRYVLWPLYENKCGLKDPFKPLVELWKHNAELRFNSESHVLSVYVKELIK